MCLPIFIIVNIFVNIVCLILEIIAFLVDDAL